MRVDLIQCLKIVSYKQTLRRRSAVSELTFRNERVVDHRAIFRLAITSSWIPDFVVDSLRHSCRFTIATDVQAVAPIVDSHRIRLKSETFAQLKPLEVSAGPDENG